MDNEIALFVATLRYLYLLYQNAHWQVSGQNFYSSHLLFQRLYEEAQEGADAVGERFVGLFGSDSLNFDNQIISFLALQKEFQFGKDKEFISFVKIAIRVELDLVQQARKLRIKFQNTKEPDDGLDDLLMEQASKSESRIYLLKQSL